MGSEVQCQEWRYECPVAGESQFTDQSEIRSRRNLETFGKRRWQVDRDFNNK